ncbi:MAG: NMD3-related protein [Desulfurococcaceae archaeon]
MWFCVNCGRALPREELIRGYCVDCFKQRVQVLRRVPEVKVVTCPRCGSWLHKGEWNPPSIETEMLEVALSSEVRKNLIEGVELQAVHVINWEQGVGNTLKVEFELNVVVENKVLAFNYTAEAKRAQKICERCSAKAAGKYSYLIQVRFAEDSAPNGLLRDVEASLLDAAGEAIVDLKVTKEGIDLELDDGAVARKAVESMVKKYAAHVSSSFKSTKFNARAGKWVGITTYSVKIPVFSKGEVALYRERICIILDSPRGRRLAIWLPDTDSYESVDVNSYWCGLLRKPTRVEREDLVVESIEEDYVTVREANTGATRSIKLGGRSAALKRGDKILLIRADNLETLVTSEKVII